MSSSHLFLFIALILCIQFTSVLSQEQPFIGIWKSPSLSPGYPNSRCCVPDSITIEKVSSSEWTAAYSYNSTTNANCKALFDGANRKLQLARKASNPGTYGVSTVKVLGSTGATMSTPKFTFTPLATKLTVQDFSVSSYESPTCDFSMTSFKSVPVPTPAPVPSKNSTSSDNGSSSKNDSSDIGHAGLIIGIVIAVILILLVVCKSKQNKQVKKIRKENNAAGYAPFHNYNAPQVYYPQVYVQPQVYAQPVQPTQPVQPVRSAQPVQPMPIPNAEVALGYNGDIYI